VILVQGQKKKTSEAEQRYTACMCGHMVYDKNRIRRARVLFLTNSSRTIRYPDGEK
jgi:hypothetical protein